MRPMKLSGSKKSASMKRRMKMFIEQDVVTKKNPNKQRTFDAHRRPKFFKEVSI
jgi:hypothetical protein